MSITIKSFSYILKVKIILQLGYLILISSKLSLWFCVAQIEQEFKIQHFETLSQSQAYAGVIVKVARNFSYGASHAYKCTRLRFTINSNYSPGPDVRESINLIQG